MSHKIERDGSYHFGVLREQERAQGNSTGFLRSTECGERCWSGERFLHHGCKTFEEFLRKNPLKLPANRIFSFFKVVGDQKELVYEGNPSPATANIVTTVVQPTTMGDAVPVHTPPPRPDHLSITQERNAEIERLKNELSTAKNNMQAQEQTIRDLRYMVADKDREILHTKAQLEAQKQIHDLKTQQLLDTHEREITDLRRIHDSEMKIVEERVALDAQRALGDMMKKDTGLSDGIQMLAPVAIDIFSRAAESLINRLNAPQQGYQQQQPYLQQQQYPQQPYPQQQQYPQQPYQQQGYQQQTVPARQSAYENEVYQ